LSNPTSIKDNRSRLAFRQQQLLSELRWLQPHALHLFPLKHLRQQPVVGLNQSHDSV
jgi:hypothetical protein